MTNKSCCGAMLLTLLLAACGDDAESPHNNNNNNDNQTALCGNGVTEGVEECDDGPANSDTQPDACRSDCTDPGCGDGVSDSGESCDDGAQNSDQVPDACRSDCTPPRCGDDVVDVGAAEECDEGTALPTATCNLECQVIFCGNGITEPGEQCDDGNNAPGDGCGPVCLREECGNGFIDADEECDDGNLQVGDTCGQTCQIEACGNGIIDPIDLQADLWEVCDDGNTESGDGCRADCFSDETCGNGEIDLVTGELCDDASQVDHDGCSSTCGLEVGYWQELRYLQEGWTYSAAAYDSLRDRVVLFGGRGDAPTGGWARNETWEFDGHRWVLVDTPISPPHRQHPAMAYDAHRQRVVLFGGNGHAGDLGDTWEFDGLQWQKMQTAHAPEPRYGGAMAYDSDRQLVVLYGGDPQADTWLYDGSDWTEVTTANHPNTVTNFAMAYLPGRGMVLFGGRIGNSVIAETWEFNGTDWAQRTTGLGTVPSARESARMVYDEERGALVLFGGNNGATYYPDTYQYSASGWAPLSTSAPPPERSRHAMVYRSATREVLVVGGQYSSTDYLDDTWVLGGTSWREVAKDVVPPPPERVFFAMADDPPSGHLVLFGGRDAAPLGDTWLFDGAGWILAAPRHAPPARYSHAMAGGTPWGVVLFGGYDTALRGDTWAWDGSDWVRHYPSASPDPRATHVLSYDSRRGVVVLFGGSVSGNPVAETWEYDGQTWVETTPTPSPQPREDAAMAFDARRGRTVLFGGYDDNGDVVADTWEYDGTTWEPMGLSLEPVPRYSHAMAFHAAVGRVVLFGGLDGYQFEYLQDTWEYDGTTWRELTQLGSPAERYRHAMGYHSGSQAVLLWGGENSDGITWRYRYQGTGRDEQCRNGEDDDGDGRVDCADWDCNGRTCGPDGLTCAQGVCDCPGGAVETACYDGVDDDCDGLTDCADPDCGCPGATCSSNDQCESGLCDVNVCGAYLVDCLDLQSAAPSTPDGVYAIDPDGPGGTPAFAVYCDMTTDNGGWTLVRRQRPGRCWWDNPDDNLAGTAAYGLNRPDPVADRSFGVVFDQIPFTHFRFQTGDDQKWLVTHRDEVYTRWDGTQPDSCQIEASHLQATPYAALWYKRTGNGEDPWISAQDHGFGGTTWNTDTDTHSMLYGENLHGWCYYVDNRNGVNVWVR